MKKKIFALVLCVALLAVAIVGGTLAYFTDTGAAQNTFTMGKVDIELSEPNYKGDEDGELHVYPGQSYDKDPTIKVKSDSEDCWLVATVTIYNKTELYDLYEGTEVKKSNCLDLAGKDKFLSGGVVGYDAQTTTVEGVGVGTMLSKDNANVAFLTYAEPDGEDTEDTIVYTFYFVNSFTEDQSVVLFDKVNFPSFIENDELSLLTIDINAYAIQKVGFDDVYAAYTAYQTQNP